MKTQKMQLLENKLRKMVREELMNEVRNPADILRLIKDIEKRFETIKKKIGSNDEYFSDKYNGENLYDHLIELFTYLDRQFSNPLSHFNEE